MLLNLESFKNLFYKKKPSTSIRGLVRLEVILDYYLPDIVKSLIYAGLVTSIGIQLYTIVTDLKLGLGTFIVMFFLSLASYAYSKAGSKSNLSLILPAILVLSYQRIIADLIFINVIYLYILTPLAFIYFFSKCKSYKRRIEDVCEDYLKIDLMSDEDFEFLLKNTLLYLHGTKALINIAHYNSNFEWLRRILTKTKIKSGDIELFYKVLPFFWLSPKEAYEIIKDYKLINDYSNDNVFSYLCMIDTSITHNNLEVANEISYELLSNNKDINFIRGIPSKPGNEMLHLEDSMALIEKCWLELNLKKTNETKVRKIKI